MEVIKNILKRILPTPFLKKAFLIYNRVKILTVDKILFPEYKIATDQFLIYRKGFPFREAEVKLDMPEDEAKTYMQAWYDWTQEEYLLIFKKKCWIEPHYGWAIVEPNKLLYYSLGVSRTWSQKKPGYFKFIKKKEIIHFPEAISLRDSGEENYFHFYNDVLSKLYFLQEHSIDVMSFPIIVSSKLWMKEYFQYYLKNSLFMQSLHWIVHDRQYIQCDSVIFCKPLTHRKDLWKAILSPIVVNNVFNPQRKIFLTRSKARLRFIENTEEIEAICFERSFEIMDADALSYTQQVELFSQASCIVGIHGAGLTNMVFSRGHCKILEVFPPPDLGYLPYHYILLATMKGFQYRALVGEPNKINFSGGFHLDKDRFSRSLIEFGL